MAIRWQGNALVIALVCVILAVAFGPMLYRQRESNRLLKHGASADARVLSIRDTGDSHNDQPEVRIRLEIMPANQSAFEASVTTFISPVHLARFQPGATVAVRYDPASRKDVALVPP